MMVKSKPLLKTQQNTKSPNIERKKKYLAYYNKWINLNCEIDKLNRFGLACFTKNRSRKPTTWPLGPNRQPQVEG